MPVISVHRWSPSVIEPTTTAGTQYVDGVLTISGTLNVYLNATVYASANIYALFDWTGTGSFPVPSQVSNIVLNNIPPGRTLVNGPIVSGSRIIFELA